MPRWFAPAAVLLAVCLCSVTLGALVSIPLRWLYALGLARGIALAGSAVWARRWPAVAVHPDRALAEEIAARRIAEAALATSETRLAVAQSLARIGSWEWDPLTGKVIWSDMLYRLLGYAPGEVPATFETFLQCVHPEDRELLRSRMKDAVEKQVPYDFDFRIVQPGGQVRVLSVQALIDRDANGTPILWRGTDQDVTDRVAAEEDRRRLDDRLRATQRWDALGQLAGGVAHDFNNLMAGVLGNATLAREQLPAESPLHEHLAPIEDAAHHAASLCQQLLAFAGKGLNQRATIEVQSLINESVELIRMGVPRNVELRIGTTQDLPLVEGDGNQIKQALLNLVWNAAEAIGPAGGLIEIRTGSTRGGGCTSQAAGHYCSSLQPDPYVWIDVRDTGCGIAADTLPRIFDPFFSTKEMGRGLGLSSVAGIVRSHGGVACVTSQPGKGSSVRIYLAAIEEEASRRSPPVNNTPRVLALPASDWRETLEPEAV